MMDVAKAVDFTPLTVALQLKPYDVTQIQINYQEPDRRCYQALDTWSRRGVNMKRRTSELLQVLQEMGKTDLVKSLTGGKLIIRCTKFCFSCSI